MIKLSKLLFQLTLCVVPVFANVTIYDTTGASITNSDQLNCCGLVGFSFTNTTGASLADVKISFLGNGSGTGSATISLYSNNASGPQPGSVLCSIGSIADSSVTGFRLVDFPVSGACPIAANTRYWIVINGPSSALYANSGPDPSGTGVTGEYQDYDGVGTNNGPVILASVTVGSGTGPSVPAASLISLLLMFAGLICVGVRALVFTMEKSPLGHG